MSMSVFYYLSDDDKEKCFVYYAKGTIFQDQPAYVTAYDVCKGLTAHFNEVEADACRFIIPLRDASSGRHFTVAATQGVSGAIDKMISWLRAKHYIFYTPGLNLDAVLDHDRLSYRVNAFWNAEDKRQEKIKIEEQQKIENYCKSDVAVATASDEIGSGGHVCTVCKGRVCDQFVDILHALGIKEGVLYPARGQSMVDAYAKAAKVRAEVIFNEPQKMQKQIDELNERIHNQEEIIKAQNKSLIQQKKQLTDLGASLRDIKEVVDCEMDDLMQTHGDDIIPMF